MFDKSSPAFTTCHRLTCLTTENHEAGCESGDADVEVQFITDLYYGMIAFTVFLLLHVTDRADF